MQYSKLVSVTGMSGLYELISTKADGGLVRSLEDKSTKFVSTRLHSFSHLESIEVYTQRENVNLIDVFQAMQASTVSLPDAKADAAQLKAYFEQVYPTMDFARVYTSDMKKMVKWLGILTANQVELKLSQEGEGGEVNLPTETAKPKAAETKSAAPKNAPAKKINAPRKMA